MSESDDDNGQILDLVERYLQQLEAFVDVASRVLEASKAPISEFDRESIRLKLERIEDLRGPVSEALSVRRSVRRLRIRRG